MDHLNVIYLLISQLFHLFLYKILKIQNLCFNACCLSIKVFKLTAYMYSFCHSHHIHVFDLSVNHTAYLYFCQSLYACIFSVIHTTYMYFFILSFTPHALICFFLSFISVTVVSLSVCKISFAYL